MAKLTRVLQKIFGSSGSAGQFSEIGSYAAGSPTFSQDPTAIQSLSNYLTGWFGCVLGSGSVNAPAIQDMNALDFLITRQLAYLFQEGIPEWDATTTYYIGSLVNSGGVIYVSLQDNNLNNALTNQSYWSIPGSNTRTVTGTETATAADSIIFANATSASFTETLPDCTATPIGKQITVKCVHTNANTVTVKGTGSQLIDFANSYQPLLSGDSVTFFNTGSLWYVI